MALARNLADSEGISHSWRTAVEAVPRHVLVPSFYRQENGEWRKISANDPGFFETVYSDTALTTQITDGIPTSSSSQPSLMLHMLDALNVEDGNRVLEIATGTGYNAALLCDRLGSDQVWTVEVDRELTGAARTRLHSCGYRPVILTRDGREGCEEGGLYDRLIATCGFTAIPYPWIKQVRAGGIIVSPLGWGNAQLIVGEDGTAEGKFLPGGSCFMGVRSSGGNARIQYPGTPATPSMRETRMNASLAIQEVPQFMLSLVLPEMVWAHEMDANQDWAGCRLWARDGSWAHVEGERVRQSGPRGLWDAVERAYDWWGENGLPGRERFGLTAAEFGTRYWLDSPGNPVPEFGVTSNRHG